MVASKYWRVLKSGWIQFFKTFSTSDDSFKGWKGFHEIRKWKENLKKFQSDPENTRIFLVRPSSDTTSEIIPTPGYNLQEIQICSQENMGLSEET